MTYRMVSHRGSRRERTDNQVDDLAAVLNRMIASQQLVIALEVGADESVARVAVTEIDGRAGLMIVAKISKHDARK